MLSVDNLDQFYGGSHILRGVSFEARVGEVTVVLGRNGVGKTTLLKSLMGVVQTERLKSCENRVVFINMSPPCLYHAYIISRKIR